jgi:hypothetical protein
MASEERWYSFRDSLQAIGDCRIAAGTEGERVKRPAGVVVSAVLLALVALGLLGMALLMAFAALMTKNLPAAGGPGAPPVPPWMMGFMLCVCAFFLALAAWGIATVAGLFGMRRWARISVLIIGGGMAAMGLISLASSLAIPYLVPIPQSAGVDPARAHAAQTIVRAVYGTIAGLYALVTALGVYWLVYFNLKRVREAFAGAAGGPGGAGSVGLAAMGTTGIQVESRRPVLISILAVLCLVGAPTCLAAAFLPFPATMLGFTLHGAAKVTLYVAFGGAQGAAGVGLWRMEEWGRRLELALLVLGLVNCVIYMVRPGLMVQASAEIYKSMSLPAPPWAEHFQTILYRGTFAASILLMVAYMIPLIYYRRKFGRGNEPKRLGPVLVE